MAEASGPGNRHFSLAEVAFGCDSAERVLLV